MTLGATTVRKMLKEEKFKWGPKKKCPDLTAAQVQWRQQFVLDYRSNYFANVRGKVLVFTDECRFCKGADVEWSWHRPAEYKEKNMAKTKKFADVSIMVWGAIAVDYKCEDLTIMTGKINSKQYFAALEKFFEECDEKFGAGNWVLMQDGAPCHTAEWTIGQLCNKCRLLPFWPPNSPDLNPIEMLWAILKRRLKWDGIKTIEDGVKAIQEIWHQLDPEIINKLCRSFENRLKMVEDAAGQTIGPLLSGGRTEVPDGYLSDADPVTYYPWTEEEDNQLIALREEPDPVPWESLYHWFPSRNNRQILKRWRMLEICNSNRRWDPVEFPIDDWGRLFQDDEDASMLIMRPILELGPHTENPDILNDMGLFEN
jgi:hypothetical protein